MGMAPSDVRALLEGYDLDQKRSFSLPGTLTIGSAVIQMASVDGVLDLMHASGTGIPEGAIVADIDPEALTVTLDQPVTVSGAVTVGFTTYLQISDSWIAARRDKVVMPFIVDRYGISFSGVQRMTEYLNGNGSSILALTNKPIVQLYSINLITNPSNFIFVSPGSVEVIAEEGILKLRAVLESWQNYVPAFPRGKDNLKVDYSYGFGSVPDQVQEAVNRLVASQVLGHLAGRTGGGTSLSGEGYNRSFGQRGKYTEIRRDLESWAYVLLRRYATGFTG